MGVVTERTAHVSILVQAVKSHCMCLRFEMDSTLVRVIYPDGYFPQGVQCSLAIGKAKALGRVLDIMERHWKGSFL